VAFAFGLAASSFFPAIILGIFDKRMNTYGAVSGMIIGLIFTASYIIYFKFGGGTPEQYFMKISPEGIGTIGMFINLIIALVVSRLTPPPPDDVQEMVESIRIPRGSGEAVDH
jgi:cation/acetate symporter